KDFKDAPRPGRSLVGRGLAGRFEDHCSPEQSLRCRPGKDLAVCGGVLQPPGGSDDGAGDRVTQRRTRTRDDDFTGFYPGAVARPDAVDAARVVVQRVDLGPDLESGADGAERVVLVRDGEPEERDQQVPHRPFDTGTVPLED